MPFRVFGLDANILKAVQEAGYTEPTPIQSAAIPLILAGHDLIGIAQTGTGKTAAFVWPILAKLVRHNRHGSPHAWYPSKRASDNVQPQALQHNSRALGYNGCSICHTDGRKGKVRIDVGAKAEIQKLVLDLVEEGKSILFISSELEEVMRISNRIVVLRDRKKAAEYAGDVSDQTIMQTMAGTL